MQRAAIVDLGSNTFHLLIVEEVHGVFKELFRERVFVGLGDGGIDYLKEISITYGLEVCKRFSKIIREHECSILRVVGTAALRTASNSQAFIQPAELTFGQRLEIIDGQKEAELIYKGVSLITDLTLSSVIMDIGGGSTEFILVEHNKVLGSYSFKLGVGVMHASFHHSEPISANDENALRLHIQKECAELFKLTKDHHVINLVGASGSFEVLESMTGREISTTKTSTVDIKDFIAISKLIIGADLNQRLAMNGMPPQRVKLIVVAMILIEEIIKVLNPKNIIVSPYALKEGVLAEMYNLPTLL